MKNTFTFFAQLHTIKFEMKCLQINLIKFKIKLCFKEFEAKNLPSMFSNEI
jgi:hypothetical protein